METTNKVPSKKKKKNRREGAIPLVLYAPRLFAILPSATVLL